MTSKKEKKGILNHLLIDVVVIRPDQLSLVGGLHIPSLTKKYAQNKFPGGGFNPIEQYARQIGSSPQVG